MTVRMMRHGPLLIRLLSVYAAWTWPAAGQVPTGANVDPEIRANIQKLKDPDPAVRYPAIEMLGTLGPGAIDPLLKEVLADPRGRTGEPERLAAINALGMMGPAASPAIPMLVRTLGSERAGDAVLRVAAARTLGKIGPESQEVVPALRKALDQALKEQDISICRATAGALWEIGPAGAEAVPELIRLLNSTTESIQHLAADVLGRIGPPAARALPRLTALLKPGHAPSVRRAAANTLRQVGPAALEDSDDEVRRTAADAMNGLVTALDDPEDEVRRAAADSLAEFGPAALAECRPAGKGTDLVSKAMLALRHQLELEPPEVKVIVSAATALGRMGPLAKDCVPSLNALFRQDNWDVCRVAADALARIGPDRESTPLLIGLLDRGPPGVKRSAADALARLGRRALPAVPDLVKLLNDARHWEVRRSAADALGQIGPEARDAVEDLRRVLAGDTQDLVRRSAAVALGRIGVKDQRAYKVLVDLVEDKQPIQPWLRQAATVALWQLGPDASLGPAFIRLLKDDPDWEVRRAAIDALAQIGPKAVAAVPILRESLKEPAPWEVRRSAADALRTIVARAVSTDAAKAVPTDVQKDLVDALVRDWHSEVRRSSVYALLFIGPGPESSGGLIKALDDRDWVVRRAAAAALAEIDPPPVPNLIDVLRDPKEHRDEARASAAEALRQIRSKANSALPSLAKTVAIDLDPNVRQSALEAIREICSDLRANAGKEDLAGRKRSLYFVDESLEFLDVQSPYARGEPLVGQAQESIEEAQRVLQNQPDADSAHGSTVKLEETPRDPKDQARSWTGDIPWWIAVITWFVGWPLLWELIAKKHRPGEITGRRMTLKDFDGEIREVLRPLMADESSRRARLTRAFAGYSGLLDRINFGGDTGVFLSNLINTLGEYGEVETGRLAICVLLDSVKGDVGVSVRVRIARITRDYPR